MRIIESIVSPRFRHSKAGPNGCRTIAIAHFGGELAETADETPNMPRPGRQKCPRGLTRGSLRLMLHSSKHQSRSVKPMALYQRLGALQRSGQNCMPEAEIRPRKTRKIRLGGAAVQNRHAPSSHVFRRVQATAGRGTVIGL